MVPITAALRWESDLFATTCHFTDNDVQTQLTKWVLHSHANTTFVNKISKRSDGHQMAKCIRNKNCIMTQNEDNTFFRTLRLSQQNLFNYRLLTRVWHFPHFCILTKQRENESIILSNTCFLNGLDKNRQFSSEIWISRKFATMFLPKFIQAPLRSPLENPLKSTSNTIKSTP